VRDRLSRTGPTLFLRFPCGLDFFLVSEPLLFHLLDRPLHQGLLDDVADRAEEQAESDPLAGGPPLDGGDPSSRPHPEITSVPKLLKARLVRHQSIPNIHFHKLEDVDRPLKIAITQSNRL
jgi:hypothetical protein